MDFLSSNFFILWHIFASEHWVFKYEIEEECRHFGCEFGGGGACNPREKGQKFAIKLRWEFSRQLAQNSQGQNKNFTPNPLCRISVGGSCRGIFRTHSFVFLFLGWGLAKGVLVKGASNESQVYHPGVNLYIYNPQEFWSCNDWCLYG